MWNKLKKLLEYMESLDYKHMSKQENEKIKENLLIEISFFQHERLIHLIVTVCFAFLTFINLIVMMFIINFAFLALEILFLVLLAPYILHYYRLENGVQRLYTYYEKLEGVIYE